MTTQEKQPSRRKRPSRAKPKPQVVEHWHQGGSMCCPHPDCVKGWKNKVDAPRVGQFREALETVIGLVDNQRFRYEANGADGLRDLLSEIQDIARKAIA